MVVGISGPLHRAVQLHELVSGRYLSGDHVIHVSIFAAKSRYATRERIPQRDNNGSLLPWSIVEPLKAERSVIDAAEALARSLGDNDNHTVAAAVMDVDGRIHQAVNVYHFTGGPCAELVALGVAAAAGAKQLLTIAAAGDRGRGLIPPCGRCRQVLLDHHPDILVAVPAEKGPAVRPVRKLLPDTYFYPDAQGRRILRFNKRYYDAVISGEKTTTTRWDEPVETGQTTFVFEDHPEFAHVTGEITSVAQTKLQDLDAEQARGLKAHYPLMPEDAELLRVSFRVHAIR